MSNIAMVVRAFATDGGLELYAHRLVEGLLERDHKVTVFCQNLRSDLSHANLTIASIEKRSDKLPKAKRLVHDHTAGNKALKDPAAGFDIVHSQHYPTSYANVVTFHNHSVHRGSAAGFPWECQVNKAKLALVSAYKLRDQQDAELCRNAACLIFPSQVMQSDYFTAYPFLQERSAPYVVAHPGASFQQAPSSSSGGTDDQGRFTFLFVGRGYRRKGLDMVLKACARLKSQKKEFRLLIAGLKEKPVDRANLHLMGLADRVTYLGFRKDMDNVFAMADAAVLPSRIEPFGMAPLQAMSCGLVPIVSRVSGVSEVLQHDHDSLILEDHLDADELSSHMHRLMENPEFLRQLRRQAPITAARVDWNQTVENTLTAYAKVK